MTYSGSGHYSTRCMNYIFVISRFLAIMCLFLAVVGCNRQKEAPEAITVVSFGGAYQDAQRTAYMVPFAKETGIAVNESDYNGDYALLSSRATSQKGSWDVVSIEAAVAARGALEGIFSDIDYSVVDTSKLLPGAAHRKTVAHLVFSTVLAYSTVIYPEKTKAPKTWADFFNIKDFPGKRGLRDNPRGSLEIGLLGNGVAADKLYPLDVDAAFRALDKVKDQLEFWDSGAQPVQMLDQKRVVMSSAYNGRIWDAKIKENLPLDWSWNQGLMEMESWGVPMNSQHVDAAMRFIAFSVTASAQAAFTNAIAYGPTNKDALQQVKHEVIKALPNSDDALSLQVPVDPGWWAENEKVVSTRWQKWVSSR